MPSRSLVELGGDFRRVAKGEQIAFCLRFFCPICPSGHGIEVSYAGPSLFDNGFVWTKTGDSLDDVSLSPSIDCTPHDNEHIPGECTFHGWVRGGKVEW